MTFSLIFFALTIVSCKQDSDDDDSSSSTAWTYPTETPTPTWEGSGSSINPYIIKTAQQLADLAYLVNSGNSYGSSYFKLDNDLDLNPGKSLPETILTENDFLEWIPIGTGQESGLLGNKKCFSGTFDGNGHTIKGLYVSQSSSALYSKVGNYAGLFGYVKGGNIVNLILGGGYISAYSSGSSFSGNNYAGSLVGYLKNGNIINCGNEDTSVKTSLSEKYVCLGGLVGGMEKSSSGDSCSIINSYVKAKEVWGVNSASESYSYTGGIVGIMEGGSSVINCFNNTPRALTGMPGTIGDCLGGIAGKADSDDSISWCYWNEKSTYSSKTVPVVGDGSPTTLDCAGFEVTTETISGYTSGTLLQNLNEYVTYVNSQGRTTVLKSWTSLVNPELVF